MAKKIAFPAWVTESQKELWANRVGLKEIEIKSLVDPLKKLQAIICRPTEIAVMMSSSKMSAITGSGNNLAESYVELTRHCCIKSAEFLKECELAEGSYAIDYDIQIGRLIKGSYESAEITIKKSLYEA